MANSKMQVECDVCHKRMRADNIQRHKSSCSYKPSSIQKLEDVSTNNSIVADDPSLSQSKPFTLGMLNDLVNKKISDPANPATTYPSPPPAKRSKSDFIDEKIGKGTDADEEDDDDVDGDEDHDEEEDEEDDNEEEDDDEEGVDDRPGINDIKDYIVPVDKKVTKVIVLPGTLKGLEEKLALLLAEYNAGNTTTHNEIVAILDELKRGDGIDEEHYTKCNNLLAGTDPVEDVDDIIDSTSDFLISHDKKELLELLDEFEEQENFNRLQNLVNAFLEAKDDTILKNFDDLFRSSTMLKSKILKLKKLLDHIDHNRYRVHTILSRLAITRDEEDWRNAAKVFAREELLSPQQFAKIVNADNLKDAANIIKDTKIGHRIKFLPTKLNDLKEKLEELLEETEETQLKAVLEELLRRNGISLERYKAIKDDYL